MAYYLFIPRKYLFCMSHDKAGQSLYCNPPWSLAVQYVEHIRTCHAKSPMNTKDFIVLFYWPQFNAATTGLRLMRQVPTDIPMFTKPRALGKIHIVVKAPWAMNYWVIDKDAPIKVLPSPVKSVVSSKKKVMPIANLIVLPIGYLRLQH